MIHAGCAHDRSAQRDAGPRAIARVRSLALVAWILCICTQGCAVRRPSEPKPSSFAGSGVEVVLWSLADLPSDVATNAPGARAPQQLAPAASSDAQSLAEALLQLRASQQAGDVRAPRPTLEAWEGSGLRVIRLRASEALQLGERFGASAGQRRSWVLFGNQPSELVRGPRAGANALVSTDAGPLDISNSALMLSMRSWPLPALPAGVLQPVAQPEPTPEQAAFAQVELLLSLVRSPARERGTIVAEQASRAAAGDGADNSATLPLPAIAGLLPRLTLSAVLQDGDCLLVEPLASLATDGAGAGPPVPALPSLGDALLSDALAFPRSGVRIAVVLRPVLAQQAPQGRP